jgi:hypothetical protein
MENNEAVPRINEVLPIRKKPNMRKKQNDYNVLMKRQNNKLSYLRKKHNLTDDDKDYKEYKVLYPEIIIIKDALKNINLISSNNTAYTDIKTKLHELIDKVFHPL